MMRKTVAIALASPLMWVIAANAQMNPGSRNPFDGVYQGVSWTAAKYSSGPGYCEPISNPIPPRLTVVNGTARAGNFEGTVSPQGVLMLKRTNGYIASGRIDPQGNATAQGSGTACQYTMTWRKVSG